MARTVLPVAATAILTGALAASPLGTTAIADPGPGGDGHQQGDGHHGGGDDGWDGHHGWDGGRDDDDGDGGWNDGWNDGWNGEHDGWSGAHDQPAQKPAPAAPQPAPAAAAPAAPAPAPAEPAAPVLKKFPYTAPTVETDLSGLTLEKAGGELASSRSTSSGAGVGTVVGTGVALAAIGGFAAQLTAGRTRRGATP
jgi:hypothetical protein